MLPKDINNITEPVYKRLKKDINDAVESIPVLLDIIDLFDVKVSGRATTLQDVFDKFNELHLEYDTRYFIRQFKYGENQGGAISTKNMYDCIFQINKLNYGSTTYSLSIYPLYLGSNNGTGTIQILKFYADAYPDFTKDLTYYSRYLVILGETNRHSTGVNDAKTYVLKYIGGSTRFIEDTGVGTKLYKHVITNGTKTITLISTSNSQITDGSLLGNDHNWIKIYSIQTSSESQPMYNAITYAVNAPNINVFTIASDGSISVVALFSVSSTLEDTVTEL